MLNTADVRNLRDRCQVLEDSVLAKQEYFIDVGIWPWRSVVNPAAWLSNFEKSEEREHALYLLDAFMYFISRTMEWARENRGILAG